VGVSALIFIIWCMRYNVYQFVKIKENYHELTITTEMDYTISFFYNQLKSRLWILFIGQTFIRFSFCSHDFRCTFYTVSHLFSSFHFLIHVQFFLFFCRHTLYKISEINVLPRLFHLLLRIWYAILYHGLVMANFARESILYGMLLKRGQGNEQLCRHVTCYCLFCELVDQYGIQVSQLVCTHTGINISGLFR
jgi:hypothetical protein